MQIRSVHVRVLQGCRKPVLGVWVHRYKRLFRAGFQARSKDQEILEEGGGAGPSHLPRRDHE